MKCFRKSFFIEILHIVHMGNKTQIPRIDAMVKHCMKDKGVIGAR